ncbi:two-component system sensor histidine kinase NtrB [Viridibacterium curvum]|uniref:histidine kinase n=1 Tax=Viridibacterium curvum TaxID=1101404 RepID=A0ABP9Q6E7_9RHOO
MTLSLSRLEGDTTRSVSLRYFNFYRVVIASLLAIFGSVFSIGSSAPQAYAVVAIAYWFAAIAFAVLTPRSGTQLKFLLTWQVALDVVVLTGIMFISGSQRGTVPYLLMSTLAGAALVAEGRLVLGFAAMTTIAVLTEQGLQVVLFGVNADDMARTGIICLGYFAVALVARLLARRAIENELLAQQRGQALQRQMRVNHRIIEDMQDGVIVLDIDNCVRQSNPRAVDLVGVELVEGEPLDLRVPALGAALRAGQHSVRFEQTGKLVSLRKVEVEVEEGGDTVLYLEDTDRIEAQARQLKLAALGRLTANIAHEIRNPLASVSQAAELLVDEKRAAMQQRLSRIVLDNAGRIDRIVRDVLELGRRDRTTPELLDATLFVHNCVEEFAMHTESARRCVVVQSSEQPRIHFDRVHLTQILGNLLGNALRYCRQEPGSVEIRIAPLAEGVVLIAIRDDGPGIQESQREQVFEPFHTTDPKGTGLGLYVARELAVANAASLSLVDSAAGAEFHLIARSEE